jgi:hypothetical protein
VQDLSPPTEGQSVSLAEEIRTKAKTQRTKGLEQSVETLKRESE